jgi:hypothetical protein
VIYTTAAAAATTTTTTTTINDDDYDYADAATFFTLDIAGRFPSNS